MLDNLPLSFLPRWRILLPCERASAHFLIHEQSGGPQRKEVNQRMTDGDTGGGMLERLRNSPRTVSTIIVILIVLGAIFAFSDRGAKPETSPAPTATPAEENASPATTPEGAETTSPEAVKAQETTPKPSSTPFPEAKETESAYVEVAARGDGVTHLARRAMLRYLESNKPDYDVTAEHKVWIEDSLKDQIGRTPLRLGESLEVSKDLVRDAVTNAKQLTDAQRKHLTRYSQMVAAYR